MQTELLKILLVEDNPSDVRLLQEAMAETETVEFELGHVDRLSEALARLKVETFDLILLDLMLPDSMGFETLTRIREADSTVPLIVLTIIADESLAVEAVQQGAQDYLVKEEISSRMLVWGIRYAIERQRQVLALEQELRALARLARPPQATITAQSFGLKPLSESLPATFNELVEQYVLQLELALEQRAYKINHNISDNLRTLSKELGILKARPRDIIDIHTTALKKKINGATPKLAQTLIEEGRLQLLELMGGLTLFYLNHSFDIRKPIVINSNDETLKEDGLE
ncbi:MAG TPA: response regulator [Anaerolineae bacterium]